MAAFPELIPSQRTYAPGAYPHTAHRVYRGSEARVRHSNAVLGNRLRLFFPALTTAELVTVRDHYNGQRGRFFPFAIPDEILSGLDDPGDFTRPGYQWRYAAKPVVRDIAVDGDTPSNFHDLTVELEGVPPENTIAPGARITPQVQLRPGSAERGAVLQVLVTITPGAAGGADAGGSEELALEAEVSIRPGRATPSTLNLTAEVELTPGGTGGNEIPVGSITYSQSSVYFANEAATNAGMTNNTSDETLETGTDGGTLEWVRMDLGATYRVRRVFLGSPGPSLAGGWDETYLNGCRLQYSLTGSPGSWTTETTLSGIGNNVIVEVDVDWDARYIQLERSDSSFIAVTEFYATTEP